MGRQINLAWVNRRMTWVRVGILQGVGACLFAAGVASRAEGLPWESAGLRGAFSATRFKAQFYQTEAFVDWDLPWRWELGTGWRLRSRLDLSAGWLRGRGDDGFVGTLGPSLTLRREQIPLFLVAGVSQTWLSRDKFGTTDFGIPFQFTSHAGLGLELGSHFVLGYRFQHMSNANLGSHNPGLNLHAFAIGCRF